MRGVPAVCVGDRCVSGSQLKLVAKLLGLNYEQRAPELSPTELVAKMDGALAAAQRFLRQMPLERLNAESGVRDRSLRSIGYHIFHVARAFVIAAESGQLPGRMIMEEPPDSTWTGEQLADDGEEARRLVRRWWADGSHDFSRPTETYYGTHPLHEVMERSTWHSAQHTRQLLAILEQLDIDPDGPLTEHDLAGLPLPEGVWD
jgi:hypothetical protein